MLKISLSTFTAHMRVCVYVCICADRNHAANSLATLASWALLLSSALLSVSLSTMLRMRFTASAVPRATAFSEASAGTCRKTTLRGRPRAQRCDRLL